MSCQCCQGIGHSCSNPVHNHQYQTVSTVFILIKRSDRWRVSPSRCAMLRAEKLEFSRHTKENSWLLMPLRDRLPSSQLKAINAVDIDMSCFLSSSYQMPQPFANRCNDKISFCLPRQMSPTVALTKFLSDRCEGPIHPSSFAKELLFDLPLRKDWTFSQTEDSSHSSSNPAPKHIAGRTGTCSISMSCPSICEAIQISDHCEEPFASEFPSLPKIRSMKSVFPGRVLIADAAVWRTTLVDVPVCGKNEHSMLHYQDFTAEVWHCYKRLNGGCWVQVARGCSSGHSAVAAPRKVSSIFATSSEWWYILNEIKEAYRMERYFSDHVTYRLYHSSAKLSASWDLFACISPEKVSWGSIHAG